MPATRPPERKLKAPANAKAGQSPAAPWTPPHASRTPRLWPPQSPRFVSIYLTLPGLFFFPLQKRPSHLRDRRLPDFSALLGQARNGAKPKQTAGPEGPPLGGGAVGGESQRRAVSAEAACWPRLPFIKRPPLRVKARARTALAAPCGGMGPRGKLYPRGKQKRYVSLLDRAQDC